MEELFIPPISKSKKPKAKSRVKPAFKNVLRKSCCFWKSSLQKQPLWLGFWLLGRKAKAKSPTKRTLHSHMIESWKWMEGQILTELWLRSDQTLAQSLVSSFDQGEIIWCNRTLSTSVRSTPVRFQRGKIMTRHCPAFDHNLNTRVWGELTGASGQHDQSVQSPRRGT